MRTCMLTTYSYKEIESQRGESHVPRSAQPADGNPGTQCPWLGRSVPSWSWNTASDLSFHVRVGDRKNDISLLLFFRHERQSSSIYSTLIYSLPTISRSSRDTNLQFLMWYDFRNPVNFPSTQNSHTCIHLAFIYCVPTNVPGTALDTGGTAVNTIHSIKYLLS